MFYKAAFLTLSIGVVAAALLANRQLRVRAAHDLAEVQRNVAEHDRTLWRLRLEIAARVTPEQVELAAKRLGGELAPINAERYRELVRREQQMREGESALAMSPPARP